MFLQVWGPASPAPRGETRITVADYGRAAGDLDDPGRSDGTRVVSMS